MKIQKGKASSVLFSLLAAGITFSSTTAHATSVTVNASNSGYYLIGGGQDGTKANPAIFGDTVRDWLGFDLSGINGVITSATLQVNSSGVLNASLQPVNATGQTINWWDVTTPYANLGTVSGVGIFNDLGGGTLFGQGPQIRGTINSYVLNADALAALNASENSKWAIGGQEAAGGGYAFGGLSGVSSPNNPIQLVLEVQPRTENLRFLDVSNVPETGSSVAMIALGFCAVVGFQNLATRRKQAMVRA